MYFSVSPEAGALMPSLMVSVQIQAWEMHCKQLEQRLALSEAENSNLHQALAEQAAASQPKKLKDLQKTGICVPQQAVHS